LKRTVLITGVFGGIGYATAKVFKSAGWEVIGVDKITRSDSENLLDWFFEKDISVPDNVVRIFEDVHNRHIGGLNCLVNNAAAQVAKSVLETTEDEWDAVFDTNVKSVFISAKKAFALLETVKGSIVNICSVHAFATSQNISAYAASKGAILAFTRSLALEFGGAGIRVNCVIPGAVNTKMLAAGLNRGHLNEGDVSEQIGEIALRHPIKRVGEPLDVGKLILFLGDNEQSSFITGQSFVADGGALAQLSTEKC
jgi:NAD(P)-dependent dehydrogenase (short-subunit alcohol dehydrogenase family)